MANVFVSSSFNIYFMAILKVTAFDYIEHISNILLTLSHVLLRLVIQLFVICLQDCDFDPLKYNSVIECEKPNNDLNRFRGYMWVRSCSISTQTPLPDCLSTHINHLETRKRLFENNIRFEPLWMRVLFPPCLITHMWGCMHISMTRIKISTESVEEFSNSSWFPVLHLSFFFVCLQ